MIDPVSLAAALLALLKTLGSKLDSIKTQYDEAKVDIDILTKKCGVLESVLHSIKSMPINGTLREQFQKCLYDCEETISQVLLETSKLDPGGLPSQTFKIWWNGNTMKQLVKTLTNHQLNLHSLLQANSAPSQTSRGENPHGPSILTHRNDTRGGDPSKDRWIPAGPASPGSNPFNKSRHASPKAAGVANLKLLLRQEALGNPDDVSLLVERSGLEREKIVQKLEVLKVTYSYSPFAYRKVLRALVHSPRDFNRTIENLEVLRGRGTAQDYQICLIYMELQNYDITRVIRELGRLTSKGSNPHDYTIALEYLEAKQYNYPLTIRFIDAMGKAAGGNAALFSHMMGDMRNSGFSDNLLPN